MGFLSKLLGGDKEVEKAAKGILNGLFGDAEQSAASPAPQANPAHAAPAAQQPQSDAPSGFSWGENMPAEENQYNFNGPYQLYFENIFRTDFADLRFEKNAVDLSKRTSYTFFSGASKVLVVELMSQSCSAYKLRNDCAKEGVAYLRFYFDHDGWWNTRAYVVDRMKKALGR